MADDDLSRLTDDEKVALTRCCGARSTTTATRFSPRIGTLAGHSGEASSRTLHVNIP
jgi:hypothetical protein